MKHLTLLFFMSLNKNFPEELFAIYFLLIAKHLRRQVCAEFCPRRHCSLSQILIVYLYLCILFAIFFAYRNICVGRCVRSFAAPSVFVISNLDCRYISRVRLESGGHHFTSYIFEYFCVYLCDFLYISCVMLESRGYYCISVTRVDSGRFCGFRSAPYRIFCPFPLASCLKAINWDRFQQSILRITSKYHPPSPP